MNLTNKVRRRMLNKQLRHIVGYTLIEILIVLFIISIITGVGLLSLKRNDNKRLEAFTQQLTQLILLAQEQAILQPNVIGIVIEDSFFDFVQYQSQFDSPSKKWLPLNDSLLNKHEIPSDIQVTLSNAHKNEMETKTPQIIISTSGDLTPFVMYVGKKELKARYMILGEADGYVHYQDLS